jgi:hypothetical protein
MFMKTPPQARHVLSPSNSGRRRNWPVVALLLLCALPLAGGALRLDALAHNDLSPGNARFLTSPAPIVLHIASSAIFGILGALQFSSLLRRRHPRWHRRSGWIAGLAGLACAGSGLWMTLHYPRVAPDGPTLTALRLAAGLGMLWALACGLAAGARAPTRHQAWMLRGYALGLGAGTQVLTHLPWLLLPGGMGTVSEAGRSASMGLGWLINLGLAEWMIARQRAASAGADR